MRIANAGLLVCVLIVAGCGGGNTITDSGPPAPTGNTPPPGATQPSTVTTTVGQASITKVFQPGVTSFDQSAGLSSTAEGIVIPSPPSGFKAGSVFTWNDHAYVVEQVVPTTGSAIRVSTR